METSLPLSVLLGAAAVCAALPLLWWSLASARPPVASARLTDLRSAVLQRSASERALQPLVRRAAALVRRRTPAGRLRALEQRITLAGRPPAWPLERVLAAKLFLAVGGLLGGLTLLADRPGAGRFLLVGGLALGGFLLPDLLLSQRASERRTAIQRELPDTLDQISICVGAGLGFEGAMAQAGESGKGPLAQELVRTLQEMQVGVSRREALRNLAARTDVPDVRHLVVALVQAEAYGVPIVDVLSTQAAEQRVKRRQRAEERAMKMTVKVIFPLVFCILPALFVVVIGPGAIRIAQQMLGT
jgi:tight adherence protein C